MDSKSELSFLEWLQVRYPYDAKARSKEVEQKTIDYFSGRTHLRILDLGSGTGANTRYYAPRFPSSQEWILLENERRLTEATSRELMSWAFRQKRKFRLTPDRLNIENGKGEISIQIKNASFFELESEEDICGYDLVTSNAFFDLISRERFLRFASLLASAAKPLLATLNYTSMRFDPAQRSDETYIPLYESHMRKPKGFGPPMGPLCGDRMVETLGSFGFTVNSGESLWNILSEDKTMMKYMLGFMDEALCGMLKDSRKLRRFDGWKKDKWRLIETGRLKLIVGHLDCFARPESIFPGRK